MLNYITVDPVWKSKCNPEDDINSIAIINDKIYVTAKRTHTINIYNEIDGNKHGTLGNKETFNRPNGIFALNNYLFIVERDNKRLQIIDVNNNKVIALLTIFKEPYGIYVDEDETNYNIYITDNKTKYLYKIIYDKSFNNYQINILYKFNQTVELESVIVDKEYNRIIVSDEANKLLYILNLNGTFVEYFGEDLFESEPEGMAQYKEYYIFTDQSMENNLFHFINRSNLTYSFSLHVNDVSNTDGIYIKDDSLYIIDNYCLLSKIDLNTVMQIKYEPPTRNDFTTLCLTSIISLGIFALSV
jgi:3-phytase